MIVAYFDIITFLHHSFNDYVFLQSDRSLKSLQLILENEQQTSKTKWEKMNGILHLGFSAVCYSSLPSSSLLPSPFSFLSSFSLLPYFLQSRYPCSSPVNSLQPQPHILLTAFDIHLSTEGKHQSASSPEQPMQKRGK